MPSLRACLIVINLDQFVNDLEFNWSDEKNILLKKERNICFEDVVTIIKNNKLLDIIKNQSKNHQDQYCLIINISNSAYIVPFVQENNICFSKNNV